MYEKYFLLKHGSIKFYKVLRSNKDRINKFLFLFLTKSKIN